MERKTQVTIAHREESIKMADRMIDIADFSPKNGNTQYFSIKL